MDVQAYVKPDVKITTPGPQTPNLTPALDLRFQTLKSVACCNPDEASDLRFGLWDLGYRIEQQRNYMNQKVLLHEACWDMYRVHFSRKAWMPKP